MKNDKEILSFPAGKSYELIIRTNTHAHPLKRGYPTESTSYVMFRKSGGEMDCLFRVKKTVDLYIRDILSDCVSPYKLDSSDFQRIKAYVSKQNSLFGFRYTSEHPYRFYLLESAGSFSSPIVKRPNIQGYCYYKLEDVIDRLQNLPTGANLPLHIAQMESILDNAMQKMDNLEKAIEEFKAYQPEIQKLEAYYTSPQWMADFEADEVGQFPDKLKRGVLSEDGIWNMLERNRMLLERTNI